MVQSGLTELVIGAFFEVANALGTGFLEKVYERALVVELGRRGLVVTDQASFEVTYKGVGVGNYVPDLLVEDCLIIELKCVDQLRNEHLAQCLNYLKATGRPLCLLVNFQRAPLEWKRIAGPG